MRLIQFELLIMIATHRLWLAPMPETTAVKFLWSSVKWRDSSSSCTSTTTHMRPDDVKKNNSGLNKDPFSVGRKEPVNVIGK